MRDDEDEILQRLGYIVESLSAVAADDEIGRLPYAEARALANDWRPPELPPNRAGMCELARTLLDRIEGRVVPLRAAG